MAAGALSAACACCLVLLLISASPLSLPSRLGGASVAEVTKWVAPVAGVRGWAAPPLHFGLRRRPLAPASAVRPRADPLVAYVPVDGGRGPELVPAPYGTLLPSVELAPAIADLAATGQAGASSLEGVDPFRRKPNQDAYFALEFPTYTCLGVMDGHGKDGHVLTKHLATALPAEIFKQISQPVHALIEDRIVRALERTLEARASMEMPTRLPPIHAALTRAFHLVQARASVHMSDEFRAGGTCIVCLVGMKKIHVAYVGDSRAVLVTQRGVQAITQELNVGVPSERQRVLRAGGAIRGNYVEYGGTLLAMTRALGDGHMVDAGVVPTPVVETFRRPPRGAGRLVLATDGVWDVLTNEEAAEIVRRVKPAREAAEALAEAAHERWVMYAPEMSKPRIDDISCLVYDL